MKPLRKPPFSLGPAFFLAALVFCVPAALSGQARLLSLPGATGGDGSVLAVEQSTLQVIRLRLAVDALACAEVVAPAGAFATLALPGQGVTTELGRPRLPAVRALLEVPLGAELSARLEDARWETYRLADLGVRERIVPAQAPVAKVQGAREAAPFVLDEATYEKDAWCLEREIRLKEAGIVRGYRAALLELFPVNYNPAAGTIRVLRAARITVNLSGADTEATEAAGTRLADPSFERLASRIFLNHHAVPRNEPDGGTHGGTRATGYLIIAHPDFVGNADLQAFADHKTALGFEVTLVDSNTAGGTKENIRNYIKNAVNTWPVPPAYVLLVGDTAYIGHFTGTGGDSPATDLNYVLVTPGDYFPDAYIGRFSVTNNIQLDRMIQKILAMETVHLKRAAFMASEDNYWISEGTHNWVINHYLSTDGWRPDKLYCHTYKAKTYQVTDAFNDGRSLGVYSGHGSETYWADGPYFDQGNVKALTNTLYPLVMSFACLTGKYSYSECFGETWIRDDHGAALFWGSSVTSFWDEDDVLEKKVVEGWYTEDLDRFAQMGDYGKYQLYLYLGGSYPARRYYEMYNILGDPAYKILGESTGGSFTNFGTGIPSPVYGQPTLTGEGDLTPGGSGFNLAMASVRPSAAGLLFLGPVNSGGLPFMGGYLYPFPFSAAVPVQVDTGGTLTLYGTMPPDVPHDTHIYLQAFFYDDTGPAGVTATDGLDLWVF